MTSDVKKLEREFPSGSSVKGSLHIPGKPSGDGLVLTHGAGSNSDAPLLVALAKKFAAGGVTVLRCDLPYRQKRAKGGPRAGDAERDREGLRRAAEALREEASGRIWMGGQSYGGRQATIAASEDGNLVDGLLLISYPLHPPGRPENLRTAHFPALKVPLFFAHGSKDAFGSLDEMREALRLIPGPVELFEIEGGGHGLVQKRQGEEAIQQVASKVSRAFQKFVQVEWRKR